MISIDRPTECPTVLADSPTDAEHYSKPEVVRALREMQGPKCCYCECELPKRFGFAVEHFRPRKQFPERKNDWHNLLLACPQCNGAKSTCFPTGRRQQPLLIDPSRARMNPEKHIVFPAEANDPDDPIGTPEYLSPRGRKTIEVTDLWSIDKTRARRRHWRSEALPLYRKMKKAKKHGHLRALARTVSEFEGLMSWKAEFAGFIRSVARSMEFDKRFGVKIPTGGRCGAT